MSTLIKDKDDLISRQTAIDAFMTSTSDGDKAERCKWVLEQLPSAEVEPVKRGRLEWRKEKTIWQTGYYCSECLAFFGKDYDMVKYFNYCPYCGARLSEAGGE